MRASLYKCRLVFFFLIICKLKNKNEYNNRLKTIKIKENDIMKKAKENRLKKV